MINLIATKDADRVMRNMVLGIDGIAQVPPKTRIVYHEGPVFSLAESKSKVGAMARLLYEKGKVLLFQQRVGHEKYQWIAEVR